MNHDRTFYVVSNDCGRFGIDHFAISDRKELVENIRRGELGYENVIAVHAYNPVEGWAHVVTDDIQTDVEAEVHRLRDLEDFPLSRFTQAAE